MHQANVWRRREKELDHTFMKGQNAHEIYECQNGSRKMERLREKRKELLRGRENS